MDSRGLIRIAAPAALTLLVMLAVGLDWANAVKWGALAAMSAAWIAFAWSVSHTAGKNAFVVSEQLRVLGELRTFVATEVRGSKHELERTRNLIREAAANLGTSFEAVTRKSREQNHLVGELVDGADGRSVVDLRSLALQANQQMMQLVEALEAVDGQRAHTVTRIDALASHLDGVFALLEEASSIADHTNRLALQAGVESARPGEAGHGPALVAEELRGVSERSTALNEQIRLLAYSSKDEIAKVRDTVTTLASRDMDRARSARGEAALMIERIDGMHHALGNGLKAIAECGRAIDGSLADAVRSLQFEDIATQALAAANTHMNRLSAINREAVALQELLYRPDRDADMQQALTQIAQRIGEMRGEWERPPHKSATQQSMDAGSVELF